jgi:putative transposase
VLTAGVPAPPLLELVDLHASPREAVLRPQPDPRVISGCELRDGRKADDRLLVRLVTEHLILDADCFVEILAGPRPEGPLAAPLLRPVSSAGDNAAMESFFSLLQNNVLDRRSWTTRDELRMAIIAWIERTYNQRRRQRALGKLTPVEFEAIIGETHLAQAA